jgi:acyl-CoA thioester hydrolase
MISHETSFRVRYAETDQMGIVYYSNYLVWMELGRAELCRALGIGYATMESEDGILLAVVEAHCRYLSPARYDEEISVTTSIAVASRRIVEFSYDIRNLHTRARRATGETRHVFLGRDLRPVKLPSKYHAAFGVGGP